MQQKRKRYPGVRPFEAADQSVFFGRDRDIKNLTILLALEKLVVLFGKSGYGKSSLINAGIIPWLYDNDAPDEIPLVPLVIRLGSYIKDVSLQPTKTILHRLAEKTQPHTAGDFLKDHMSNESLWFHFKRSTSASATGKYPGGRYLLIFDQFEEFFTYPAIHQESFKVQLADLLYTETPQSLREVASRFSQAQRYFLSQPLDIKVLFVIRADHLSQLDSLKNMLPSILNKRYELKELDEQQASEAIIKPALQLGDFASGTFEYSSGALETALQKLGKNQKSSVQRRGVESFQLQILCEFLEDEIIAGRISQNRIEPIHFADKIDGIYQGYYQRLLDKLPPSTTTAAQRLIEESLIFRDEQSGEVRRLSVDAEVLVQRYKREGITHETLQMLANTFLLRRDVNNLGAFSYELSHDALVNVVLSTKKMRLQLRNSELLSRKNTLILSLVLFAVMAFISDLTLYKSILYSNELSAEWHLGYLIVFLIGVAIFILFFTTVLSKWLRARIEQSKTSRFNLPPTTAVQRQINQARTAISESEPERALRYLSTIKLHSLEVEVAAISGRLAESRKLSKIGINTQNKESRTFNRISLDILKLVKSLEKEYATSFELYKAIKHYLKSRYSNRLNQKLAGRLPVNLRYKHSTGTYSENFDTYKSYSYEEISGTVAQIFRDAHGRLLLVGMPGAGVTTLMLQLALELLDLQPDALPVLLNLATWTKDYITLEAWLTKILPAELSVSSGYADEIIQQNRLILLLDGFDEVHQEDRIFCLEAISRYGADVQRQYVISSRKQEYIKVKKDAPVYWKIEVGPLSIEQLEAELNRLWEQATQPESRALLQSIQKDPLLREVVETPFYFNTLQFLFSGGKTLSDLQFVANTQEGRQAEILERFIEYKLKTPVRQEYPPEQIKHWLSFLATRMSGHNKTVFELTDLQYDWWKWTRWQSVLAGLVAGLGFGFTMGLSVGSILSLLFWLNNRAFFNLDMVDGLVLGISVCMGIGVLIGIGIGIRNTIPVIKTKGNIDWSWKNMIQNLKKSMSGGLEGGLVLVLFLTVGVGLLNGLKVAFITGLGIIVLLGLIYLFLNGSNKIIQITSPYHRFNASIKALHFSILQHFLLRYQLYKQGLLPLKLVDFLNELSLRHILEFDGDPTTGKGGGSWRFRHRILQEYFAEQWKEPEENKK